MAARCTKCLKLIPGNLLKYHSKYIHKTNNFGYSCAYSSCSRSFNTWKALRQHNKNMHEQSVVENDFETENSSVNMQESIMDLDVQKFSTDNNNEASSENIRCSEELSVSNIALKIAVQLYGDVKLSRSHAAKIFKIFIETINSEIFNSIKMALLECTSNPTVHEVLKNFNNFQSSFSKLNSEYKVFKQLRKMNCIIDPENITFGFREESYLNSVNNIKSTGSFVPLSKILKQFLELPTILEETINYVKTLKYDEKIFNVMQTKFWKSKSLKSDKFVLPIFLYEDDFECGNPLGSHAGVYKMTGMYISLPFLPPILRAKLHNIFLLQIAHSDDIKQYSPIIVYRRVVEELNNLATDGILIEKNGDNLGLNSILGFTRSFKSNYFCRFCTESKVNSTKSCKANNSLLRNKKNYEVALKKNDISQTGIKERSIFNDVHDFHVTENYCVDIMHDLFEGVCCYDIGLILHEFILVKKLFSLETANFRIKYFNYGEEKNKPPLLTEVHVKACHIKMSAAEMKCFILNVALLFGDLVPRNSKFWKLYVLLRQIICITLQTSISANDTILIDELITQHHKLYIKLFNETLKPKHHNMLHYAHIMNAVGPLVHIWSMRFEAKHSLLKVASHTSCNRKNLPLTIATKHQLYLSKIFFNFQKFEKSIVYEKSNTFDECPNTVLQQIEFINFDQLEYVIIQNIKYKRKTIIKLSSSNMPTYGCIKQIVKESLDSEDKSNFAFILQILKCVKKDHHLQSYQVKETPEYKFAKYDSLLYFETRNCIFFYLHLNIFLFVKSLKDSIILFIIKITESVSYVCINNKIKNFFSLLNIKINLFPNNNNTVFSLLSILYKVATIFLTDVHFLASAHQGFVYIYINITPTNSHKIYSKFVVPPYFNAGYRATVCDCFKAVFEAMLFLLHFYRYWYCNLYFFLLLLKS
ncbi:uncharacterized protein [Prorops nasuta]|uniref:uncharacterized protein n=1 Tax=Prorops nasuta TaxID=863751 RepID=UPI0034CDD695